MFKRQPKIKSMKIAISGDLVFIMGLGKDNNVYQWDARMCKWRLQEMPKEQPNGAA